jgi:radical SAM superfamily enzyme YgiQ (UPF0313 family)
MKIAFVQPPVKGPGIPLMTQNRQFQWYRSPITKYYIFPVVTGYAATLLSKDGHTVLWEDAVAEGKTLKQLFDTLEKEKPDLIVIESKTPVVIQHWKFINALKKMLPFSKVVLMGDHVTAYPKESFQKCKVDYVLSGGDFDFLLSSLVQFLNKKTKVLGAGIYYRNKNKTVVSTGGEKRGHNMEKLPKIDRILTKWWLYSGDNGNFIYKPNAYTMIGRDCWWRRPSHDGKSGCTFCSWTTIFPQWRVGTPQQLLDEVGYLISLGVKEIFDDTGTFPVGKWLSEFCKGMINRGYNKQVVFGCNMRAGALRQKDYTLMGKAGFRFILYGLESYNQKTLDRINKGTTAKQLEDSLKMAVTAGLQPHITVMLGYPWETKEDALKTVSFVRHLFSKGYIYTMQATILMPYPGTALFDEAVKNNWLISKDYSRYDMGELVLKTPMSEGELKSLVQKCYHSFWTPAYIKRKIVSIRSFSDITHIMFQAFKYGSKLLDFS